MDSADPFDLVCLTFDVDWAEEEVLAHTLERLDAAGVSSTFFATHPSEVLAAAEGERTEIGLHPNFNDCDGDFEPPLARIKEAYPGAVGARSHSLFFSSHILELYIRHGLRYEANIFLLEHPGLRPVHRFADLVSIPFIWSDDKQIELERPLRGDAVPLDLPGLKVLNFHPIHIFLNTRDLPHYESSRPYHRDPEALRKLANTGGPGLGTLFEELLEEISRRGLETTCMRNVADRVPGPPG